MELKLLFQQELTVSSNDLSVSTTEKENLPFVFKWKIVLSYTSAKNAWKWQQIKDLRVLNFKNSMEALARVHLKNANQIKIG